MKSITAVLVILFSFAITSCDLQKKRLQKCQKWGVCQSNDSVFIKDTIIPKADSVIIDNSEFWSSILFGCDSLGNVMIKQIDSLKAENINLSTSLKDNKLVQVVTVQGKTVYVPKIIKEKAEVKTVIVKVNELKWHQSFRLVIANIALLGLLLYICLRLIKR